MTLCLIPWDMCLAEYFGAERILVEWDGGRINATLIASWIALVLLTPVAEELFFRGAVQTAWGWIPATLLFTLLHAGPGSAYRIWTVFAAIAGLVLAGLMLWRGNLLAPVVTHVVVNGVNLDRLSRLPEARNPAPDSPK